MIDNSTPAAVPPVSRKLVILLAVLLVIQIRTDRSPDSTNPWGGARGLRLVGQVHHYIRNNFDNPPTDRELYTAAIRGMMARLGDRYSEFLPPELSAFTEDMLEDTPPGGIGALIYAELGRGLRVTATMKDGPAEKAGIKAGDLIVTVDTIDATRATPGEIPRLLRGRVGSTINLTVKRSEVILEMSFPRGKLAPPSMYRKRMLPGPEKIGYIHVISFPLKLEERIAADIAGMLDRGMKALILDFRFNGGGAQEAGVNVADLFLSTGTIITVEKQASPQAPIVKKTFTASPSVAGNFPLVILIDRNSASAAELVAGSLQDRGRAILVGETSFGKARIQGIIPLADTGASLRLTVAKFILPSGRDIEGIGLAPDIVVDIPEAERHDFHSAWYREYIGGKSCAVAEDPFLRAAVEKLGSMSISR